MAWFKSLLGEISKALAEQKASARSRKSYTPRAQQVFLLARTEAGRLKHDFLGTEHFLLGLIKLRQGVAANVLTKLGLDLQRVRSEIESVVGRGPDMAANNDLLFTPQMDKVLAFAQQEAASLHHTYVGTEHLLLGLLREADGVAARTLEKFHVGIEQARQEILKELDPNFSASDSTEKDPQQ